MSFLADLFGPTASQTYLQMQQANGQKPKLPGAIDQPPQKPADPDAVLNRKIPAEPATKNTSLGQASSLSPTSLLGGGSTTGIY